MTIEVADAFEYLGRKSSKNRFDLIIADRPDPVGPGKALFGETFYDRVKGALKPGGYATFQTGVPFYQPWEITEALQELARFFPKSGLYLTVVPTYIGGFMALTWATKGGKPLGTAGRHQEGRQGLQEGQAEVRLLQPGHPCRGLRPAQLDREAGSLVRCLRLRILRHEQQALSSDCRGAGRAGAGVRRRAGGAVAPNCCR